MTEKKLGRRDFLRLSTTVAAGALLASCATPTAPQGETGASGEEAITIRVHHRLGGECDNWTYWAKKYSDEHPNVRVEMECFPGADYFKKLNTLAAGGTIGDIVWISSIEGFYRMAATGVFAPLDDLVAQASVDLSGIYELSVEAAKHKGKIYGVPQLAHPGRTGLFYNKALFDAAGVEYPSDTWTYDDLLAAAQKLTKADEGVFGFMDPESSYFSILVDLRAWGGDVINEDGAKCPLNAEAAVAALNFRSDLYHKHKVTPLPGQVQQDATQLVAANKLAMYQSGFWGWSTRNYLEKPDVLGVAPMPKGPTGHMGSMFESDPACLTTLSQHKQEAFDFMKVFATAEYQQRAWKEHGHMPCRPDVMSNAEVVQDPMMKVFGAIFAQALPLVLPANFRETEYFKTITEELSVIWLGQNTVEGAINDIQAKAQAILDKPSLEAA